MTTITRKKLIEVALPLEAINKASAREKSIRHGHPSTLHLWWARRPLAAARAVIFAQMVDDPSTYVDVLLSDPKLKRRAESVVKARTKVWEEAKATAERAKRGGIESQVPAPGPKPELNEVIAELERDRLFRIIEDLVLWENTTNETVLQAAREEIWQSWRRACADNAGHPRAKELFDRNKLPAFHDPFAGGGALPLEAQRLGLEAYASDLNPVAVLINKAMIEIPPKFAGRPPVNPEWQRKSKEEKAARVWSGAQGLAEDVRYYGKWMRDEAEKRIGHLYRKIDVTAEMAKGRPDLKPYVGKKLTVIAWLWARTVKSPNPAFAKVDVPLASTFMLSTKAGKEAYVEPVIEDGGYRFRVKVGKPQNAEATKNGTKLSRGANFECVMSGTPISGDYIKAEGTGGRMGSRLMALVVEGDRGRIYLPGTREMEELARTQEPTWSPEGAFVENGTVFTPCLYGLKEWRHLFSPRQLLALSTFSALVTEARNLIHHDSVEVARSQTNDHGGGAPLDPDAYSKAVGVYLAMVSSRAADAWSSLVSWRNTAEATRGTFGRTALSMVWDFAEANPFSNSCGNWIGACLEWVSKAVAELPSSPPGMVAQDDAATQSLSTGKVVSTDPPYFDNVPYADLSDFFYVWLRRSLRDIDGDLFATLAVPKDKELVAFPYRHESGRVGAEKFFLEGMTRAMHLIASQSHSAFPVTLYYAFKQTEKGTDGTPHTGWETFLQAMITAGLAATGTWPIRTEKPGRMRGNDANALASSIVIACRPRITTAPSASRREFLSALKSELPAALIHLQRGNIAPVDLAQSAIGPGMAVFTRYSGVLDAAGREMSVSDALSLINEVLDEALAEQEGDFDADTRFALTWFDEAGYAEGQFGTADVLARAKNTSVQGMVEAGILKSGRGKVRLLEPSELPASWDPATDPRLTAWEVVHHLIRVLDAGGESAAAGLVKKLGSKAEPARELAYRLYAICERKKRAAEALSYNGLVQSWPEILRLAAEGERATAEQTGLFGEE